MFVLNSTFIKYQRGIRSDIEEKKYYLESKIKYQEDVIYRLQNDLDMLIDMLGYKIVPENTVKDPRHIIKCEGKE